MADSAWMIYGTGYTGSLIAQEAVRRGHRPLLAGRSAENLQPLASRLGLEFTTVDLHNAPELARAIDRVDAVMLAAGPFGVTSGPMLRACLAARKHYLDISNEIPVFQSIWEHDGEARERGLALIPGVGFGVVATEGTAKYLAEQLHDATELQVVISLYTGGSSAGASNTRLEVLSNGGWVRQNGELRRVAFGHGARRFRFPLSEQTILAIPSGDLEAAFRSTGIPNITVYGTFSMPPFLARAVLPIIQRVVASPSVRRRLERPTAHHGYPMEGPPSVLAGANRSYVWAQVRNRDHRTASVWQSAGEGYAFTASAAVNAMERVMEHRPVGALTPTQAFGADFALEIDGVQRFHELGG